jgi:Leucine-rich repeat (LRR) protein
MSTFDSIDTSGLGSAFAQRYALVVIFFSLQGEGWTNQEKWLDPSLHECAWSSGIFCQYDLSEQRVVTGFDATRNNLQGSVPDEIGLLTSSESFRIPKNTVGGTLPSTIGKMTSLSVIDCSENEIEGSIPSTIDGASNLIQLDLSSNKLNSTIPNELYSLNLLRTLSLRSNRLSGPLNESIIALQSLVSLDVRNNSLSGTIPLGFDSFPSLDIVWLDYNQFTGMLPNITNAITRKQILSLSHNNFVGNAQLSPDFNFTSVLSGEDSRIQHIDVSYNKLSGPISNTFFFLPNLKYFDLSGNSFTGTFQSNIGWLGIEHLAASNNALTGTIPIGYPTLSKCPVGLHASVLCARSDERFLCVQLIWT